MPKQLREKGKKKKKHAPWHLCEPFSILVRRLSIVYDNTSYSYGARPLFATRCSARDTFPNHYPEL